MAIRILFYKQRLPDRAHSELPEGWHPAKKTPNPCSHEPEEVNPILGCKKGKKGKPNPDSVVAWQDLCKRTREGQNFAPILPDVALLAGYFIQTSSSLSFRKRLWMIYYPNCSCRWIFWKREKRGKSILLNTTDRSRPAITRSRTSSGWASNQFYISEPGKGWGLLLPLKKTKKGRKPKRYSCLRRRSSQPKVGSVKYMGAKHP